MPVPQYPGTVTGMEQRQCTGTGKSVARKDAPSWVRCIVLTAHPSGLCNFCRKTERLISEWEALIG